MRSDIAILRAPSNLGLMPLAEGREPGVRKMADVLMHHGLGHRIGARDAGTVPPPAHDPYRDPVTGVRNGAGIRAYSQALASAVQSLVETSAFPAVLGSDCSTLIGAMLGLRRSGDYGLVYLDGHRDFQSPQTSGTGGVAGMDLACVTGRGPQDLTIFEVPVPLVPEEAVAVLGYRDDITGTDPASRGADETTMLSLPLGEVRRHGPAVAAAEAIGFIRRSSAQGFWIHVDVDILDQEIMPAVDSPEPYGMIYPELGDLLLPLLNSEQATEIQFTIYDPERDPDGSIGQQLADFIADVLDTSKRSIGAAI